MTDHSSEHPASTGELVAAALHYAARGWPVVPLHTPHRVVCSCGAVDCTSAGKHPRTRHGVTAATANRDVITAWWRRWPDANVGIATGGSLAVLDVDGEVGLQSLSGRTVPVTPVVATGHGWHHYFWTPWPVPCRVGLLPGVDLRGVGGYIVAPPSLHVCGHRYRALPGLELDRCEIAVAPPWLLGAARPPATAQPSQHWRSILRDGAGVGTRNATLASVAGYLLRHSLDSDIVHEMLAAWNESRCRPPLSPREVERTVRSIARAEARRRAHLG